ncbi:MAG: Type II/IV secretion system ATP hydrolase TadA/VirB11/CpaF, TadA subfamily [uncultured Corynebacteriales bacterium]|uniref:Type II/IV secretion system ATP hydrolase TadA/VirB11/CpaF, TadA subfamily n=1 Tax=uncultured Mycobacteriales bacterium TaxID=581187 RepID=A0A6J4J541_9ACTN|nr:MAG: Type II/IV secretion system ATP hydrolase TadA/VirB11/CpaF, TadA subfamily [uncultured Corynebacteriales bacterium]
MTLLDRSRRGADVRLDSADVASFRSKLLSEIDLSELTALSPAQRRARLERMLSAIMSREGPMITVRERGALIRQVVDEALGLGILEPLLDDESVTEIMVNGPDDIYVERAGRIEKLPMRFTSVEQLYQTIDRIVAEVNRRVDESSPMVDARLSTGERVNVIVPPLALNGPVLTIRRFPQPYTLEQLIGMGSLDEPTAELLIACVRAKLNLVISGGTGSGKTTMLNALSSSIPDHERIVTIEDSAELKLQQPHVVRLEARPANTEGSGLVSIRDLVRNSLRMRPDRIIVGEVRGGETLDMLQAMNTGHEGSLATVHANSADDSIVRLETLASMSEVPVPSDTLRDQINSAIDVIVQLTRTPRGTRRVSEVATLASRHREQFRLASLVRLDVDPDHPHGGLLRPVGIPYAIAERIRRSGQPMPGGLPVLPAENASGREVS